MIQREHYLHLLIPVLLIFLSGCADNSNKISPPKISQKEFDQSLASLEVTKDEWDPLIQITGKRDSKKDNSIQDNTSASIDVSLQKENEQSAWKMAIIGSYMGQDWLFHERIDIKSSEGSINIIVPSSNRHDQVMPLADVELSATYLSAAESIRLCKIMEGSEPMFRLLGSPPQVEAARDLLENQVLEIKKICIVFNGLRQGLTSAKIGS